MLVFELHNAKKYCLGSGVASQTPIPLYPIGQQRCFWIPGMLVFELHNAKKYSLGSGVASQTPIPLHPIQGGENYAGEEIERAKLCVKIFCAIFPLVFKDCGHQGTRGKEVSPSQREYP